MPSARRCFVFCLPLLLCACAFDVVKVTQTPAVLTPESGTAAAFTLRSPVEVKLDTGYRRTLRVGARWVSVGALPQGRVFRTDDQVLTVEGSNIYEAYIVVDGNRLVGFYLPANTTYSALPEPVALDLLTAAAGGASRRREAT